MSVIVRNAALSMVKAERPTLSIDDLELSVEAIDPPDARLGQCLKRLKPEQHKAVLLTYTYGLTHTELANRLAAPLGTVKSWLRRGLQGLRDCMKPAPDS